MTASPQKKNTSNFSHIMNILHLFYNSFFTLFTCSFYYKKISIFCAFLYFILNIYTLQKICARRMRNSRNKNCWIEGQLAEQERVNKSSWIIVEILNICLKILNCLTIQFSLKFKKDERARRNFIQFFKLRACEGSSTL